MKIPTGNFGNTVAEPQRQALIPKDNQVANAVNRVGAGFADLAEAQVLKKRSDAMTALATIGNDAHDLHDQVRRDVEEGRLKPEDTVASYRKRFAEVVPLRTDELDDFQKQIVNEQMKNRHGAIERSLNDIAIKRTHSDIGSNLLMTGEQLQREAMRDLPGAISKYEQMADVSGPMAGWTPVKIAAEKQRFKETATYNFANNTIEAAARTGDKALIVAARMKIESPDGEPIDPAKRLQLITKAHAYENAINSAADARENKAVDVYNKAFDLSMQGRFMSQEYVTETTNAVYGTSMEKPFMDLVKSQTKIAGFASLPIDAQNAELERMRAAGSDPKIGVNPTEQKVFEQLDRIHEATKKAYQENPWQAAQERGVIKDAPVITLNNMQDAQSILAERMKNIGTIEVSAGKKVSPLQPQEAVAISKLIRMMPPDQQSTALASIGELVGDSDRIAVLAKQMGDKDKTIGIAMMYSTASTNLGRYTSELILRGDRAIKDKTVPIDDKRESGWRGSIATEIGDAYQNEEVRKMMIDSAYYIQAGLASEGNGDIRRAILLATGGIVERNGSKIPIPYGWEENDLDKAIRAVKPENIQSKDGNVYIGKTPVPVEQFVQQLPNASLVHAGQGKYSVKAGMGLVTTDGKSPLVINVRDVR